MNGACDKTLDLEGIHVCHILKHWLRRLSLLLGNFQPENDMKILVERI